MPSLHFATSVTAAHVLWRTGPVAGTLGWAYALTLGHRARLPRRALRRRPAAGLALTEGVRRGSAAADAVRPPGLARASRRSRHRHERERRAAPGSTPRHRARTRPAGAETDATRSTRGSRSRPRGLLTLGGFVRAALAAPVLPAAASSPACDETWHRIRDGSPWWIGARLRLHAAGCSAAT